MVRSDSSLRRALWDQQGGRCAYCERRLRDPSRDDHRTKIEHSHPQSSSKWDSDCKSCSGASNHASTATTWRNLLLCCDGNELAGENFTCDTSKAGTDICSDFRNPKHWTQGDRLVEIDRSGFAKPRPGLPNAAATVIGSVLYLNAKALVEARMLVLSPRRKAINHQRRLHHGRRASLDSQIAAILRLDATTSEYGSTLLSLADELTQDF
jgi:uncharacterized protein (TIGR02646 family)